MNLSQFYCQKNRPQRCTDSKLWRERNSGRAEAAPRLHRDTLPRRAPHASLVMRAADIPFKFSPCAQTSKHPRKKIHEKEEERQTKRWSNSPNPGPVVPLSPSPTPHPQHALINGPRGWHKTTTKKASVRHCLVATEDVKRCNVKMKDRR